MQLAIDPMIKRSSRIDLQQRVPDKSFNRGVSPTTATAAVWTCLQGAFVAAAGAEVGLVGTTMGELALWNTMVSKHSALADVQALHTRRQYQCQAHCLLWQKQVPSAMT